MSNNQIVYGTARKTSDALAQGKIDLPDVIEALAARRAEVDPHIKAFDSIAQEPAPTRSGPLCGLPISIKDQIHVAGQPCHFGLDTATDGPCRDTAPGIERLMDAGVTVIGKTNLPPYAMDFQTFNARAGRTNNPWNPAFTPGGSSGGGAAAVAAGMSYLDIGADLSGSLRIPAAFCGVFSLLPSQGALSGKGLMVGNNSLDHFARLGPIARSVDDLALAWTHLSGTTMPDTAISAARIAVWQPDESTPVETRISDAFSQVASLLTVAKFAVSQTSADSLLNDGTYKSYGEIMGYETGVFIPPVGRFAARLFGRSAARRSPLFLAHVLSGYKRDAKAYQLAISGRKSAQQAFDDEFGDVDAVLLPVCAVGAFEHRKPASDRNGVRDYAEGFEIGNRNVSYLDALTCFTTPVSLIGNPVVTLPLGLDDRGMPIGAQLVGKRGQEWALLDMAGKLSATIPELPRPPCGI